MAGNDLHLNMFHPKEIFLLWENYLISTVTLSGDSKNTDGFFLSAWS